MRDIKEYVIDGHGGEMGMALDPLEGDKSRVQKID